MNKWQEATSNSEVSNLSSSYTLPLKHVNRAFVRTFKFTSTIINWNVALSFTILKYRGGFALNVLILFLKFATANKSKKVF
jgi:hypothetical protein